MTAGLCVCVLLVVLSTSCLGRPQSSPPLQEGDPAMPPSSEARLEAYAHFLSKPRLRQTRSATLDNTVPYTAEEDGDSRANLSELLARLISSRKGSLRKNSTVNSRASGLSANHRIKDRDYNGWMDFGRRSAEEYEYSL
ncbi:cholecystokinin [Oncorhynchus kisutch]|uniref:Gastrin/cholecystokinin peptide hormone domain-containing protein n=1 Tax=Oncorhynchus kisutch TaxID=8019 RepID=A0A8C7CWI9_ONCKI|nr:cholecystokinin [Oncorhynchus kisutch]